MLTLAIMSTYARSILPASTLQALVDTSNSQLVNDKDTLVQLFNIDETEQQNSRTKRQTNVPSDYYSNYYNNYYNSYYNKNKNSVVYRPSSADRFDGSIDNSSSDRDDNTINGQKYVYTPLFQYKATHQKHQKLFVPNLFG